MRIPTVRLVFDRKKVATKKKKGLVQMEVCYERKRKWIGTGIKVYSDQWDDRKYVINSTNMTEYNEYLRNRVSEMEKWIRDSFSEHRFEWRLLDEFLKDRGSGDSFVSYLRNKIDSRNDIRESTRKAHRRLVGIICEYGRIVSFQDLTQTAISDFDNWMHGRKVRKLDRDGNESFVPMKQQTIYGYHKLMKTYIHYGIRENLIKDDPYKSLRFKRGESEPGRFLNERELDMVIRSEMRSGSVSRARDMFVFQCFTGLSYSDLRLFDFSRAETEGGDYVYGGKRKKTGEPFFFVLLPEAMRILRKYRFKLPVVAEQSYNEILKKVARDAGIDKPLSSHWGRRTAAVILVNHGVRIEVVAKILGHASVSTTEQFYAQIVNKTIIREMKKTISEDSSNA